MRSSRERASSVAAALLLPLVDRITVMAAPCRMHASIDRITASLAEWTREVGLDTPSSAGFDRMAGRAFAGSGADSTLLFAKWLTWLFHFDDEWDEKPAGRAAGIVEATFTRLARHTAETGRDTTETDQDTAETDRDTAETKGAVPLRSPGGAAPWPAGFSPFPPLQARSATPVEVAFRNLWEETAPRMSARWRERFTRGLAAQGAACRTEAENRCAGRVPSAAEYPALRRGTAGPYLFDLVEPCLGVEVPAGLRESPTWRTLVDACNDVTAWCNDVASHHKEQANGDMHNYVTVAAHAFGLSNTDAVAWVNDRIAERAEDLRAAARRLPGLFDRFGLSPVQARNASKVACAFLAAPRAQLEWLLESSRYSLADTR
ncbi:terpene synthase family protein [Streptosporangium sp. NPDC051022]|uniref:terpene synthase family protein n=1 Tax=Streptosporangium sp. NPDC051022 TaxID=3155752 RepID=UPI003424272E